MGNGEGLEGGLKGHKEMFGRGDGDVHYLDCDDDFKGVYIGPNLSNGVL